MKSLIGFLGLISLIVFSNPLYAQYDGGIGDGNGFGQLLQSNLLGQPMGLQALFSGGNGDGHDNSISYLAIDGSTSSSLFLGGRGDGAVVSLNTLSLEGANLAQIFSGGVGDGHDFAFAQRALSGEDLSMIFNGGVGDGHDRSTIQSLMNGTDVALMFSGGEGDGHDMVELHSFLSGDNLNMMFGGGIGDGHDVSQYNGIVPFPVVLLSFDAFPEESFVLLQWVTESEQNSDYFTIEKTRDGELFLPVAKVPAAGYSDEILPYETIDHNPFEGQSFYRLKVVDVDGVFMYTHLKEVNFSNNVMWNFNLYPNPNSGNVINLDLNALSVGDELQIEIIDMKGSALYKRTQLIERDGLYQTRIDIGARLAEGSYLVRIQNGERGQQSKILLVY